MPTVCGLLAGGADVAKLSKRPGRAARDVHAVIRAQAEALKRAARPGMRDADEMPEIAALLGAARAAVEGASPAAVIFEGRRYYLRVRMALQLDVFDSPGDADPLVRGASFSCEEFGHVPGH